MRSEHRLPGSLDAPAQSRRLVTDALNDHPRAHDAVLATSELVANALKHGDATSGITVGIEEDHGAVRVWVEQPGHGFDPAVERDFHGLGFVDQVADRWGIETVDGVVRVWFMMSPAEMTAHESRERPGG